MHSSLDQFVLALLISISSVIEWYFLFSSYHIDFPASDLIHCLSNLIPCIILESIILDWMLMASSFSALLTDNFILLIQESWFCKNHKNGWLWDAHFGTVFAFLVQFRFQNSSQTWYFNYFQKDGTWTNYIWAYNNRSLLLTKCSTTR